MEKKSSPLTLVMVLLFAAGCLAFAGLMPFCELQFTDHWPGWTDWFAKPLHLPQLFEAARPFADWATKITTDGGAKSGLGDYAYSLAIGLSMIMAAIAIAAVGREDAEEKTVLPIKK